MKCRLLAIAAFGFALSAVAADKPEIASASCDSTQRTVRIEGSNLVRDGVQPAVYLQGHARPLATTLVSRGRIDARLPEGLGDGQYVVTLRRGDDAATWREIAVVLGVVGPVVVE
jgi:hypothetical protein